MQNIRKSLFFCNLSFSTRTRSFATASGEEAVPKIKPKSTTALRRSASASLPIRSNPNPTRSNIQTVFTLATAQRFLLSRLQGQSTTLQNARIFHEAFWVPNWKEGEVFVFGNGSFVCWGLGENDARTFESEVLGRVSGFQVAPLKEAETEELEFVTDRTELSEPGSFLMHLCLTISLQQKHPSSRYLSAVVMPA